MRTSYFFLIIPFFVSCSNKPHVEYYPSGGIKKEHVYSNRRDTSTYFQKIFFKNGQLKSSGNYVNGKREGIWQGWYEYPEGELAWSIEYEKGKAKPLPEKPFYEVRANDVNVWHVGTPKYLRLYIEGVEYRHMGILVTNAKIEFPSQDNDYFFVITPQKEGKILFEIGYRENDVIHVLGSDSINVLPASLREVIQP